MIKRIALMSMLAAVMIGCSSNDDNNSPQQVSFTSFVLNQLDATSDTTQPADINDVNFVYSENETEFDSVLQ